MMSTWLWWSSRSRTVVAQIPHWTTIEICPSRIGEGGGRALLEGVAAQFLRHDHLPRSGQIVDVTGTRKHGKSHFVCQRPVNVDQHYDVSYRLEINTAWCTTLSTPGRCSAPETLSGTYTPNAPNRATGG